MVVDPSKKDTFYLIDDRPAGSAFETLRGPITGRAIMKTQSRASHRLKGVASEIAHYFNEDELSTPDATLYIIRDNRYLTAVSFIWERCNWFPKKIQHLSY